MNNTENQKFIKLLEEIQKQNKSGFALQAFQVKYQREIAGEDDDQREKQLETLIDSTDKSTDHLQEIKKLTEKIESALVGVQKNTGVISKKLTADLETKLTSFKADSDKTIRESLKETVSAIKSTTSSLGKGLKTAFSVGKGLLTSPKEVLAGAGSKIGTMAKEKIKAAGGYLADIAKTEEGYTAEKERFATEYVRQQQSKGVEGTEEELLKQGKEKYTQIVKGEEELKKIEESITRSKEQGFRPLPEDVAKKQKIIEEINAARGGVPAEATITKGVLPGIEAKPEPGPGVAGINPEADNVTSAQEAIAETAKLDFDLTKENNLLLKDQLNELKKISSSLAPKTPSDLPEGRLKPTPASAEAEEKGSILGDALSSMGGKLGKGVKAAGKGAVGLGAKALKFMGGTGGKLLGAAAAVGVGAYTAYSGYNAAEDSKQAKLEDVQARLDAGEITPEQAAAERKEAGNTATVEKSGAIGEGTGLAAGAIGGAKLGAALGSFAGPIGTGVGLLAGGALGAFAGTKVGKAVGEKVGQGITATKDFFGSLGAKVKDVYNRGTSGTLAFQNKEEEVAKRAKEAGIINEKGEITDFEKYNQINKQVTDEIRSKDPAANKLSDVAVSSKETLNQSEISQGGVTTSTSDMRTGISSEKSVLGSTTLGSLFSAKGLEVGGFTGQSESSRVTAGKVEGKDVSSQEQKFGSIMGKRIASGSLFKPDTYKVSGASGEELDVSKSDYYKLQNLAKEGKTEEAEKLMASIKSQREVAPIVSPEESLTPISPGAKGLALVKDSTENAELNRAAGMQAPAAQPIVSNSVSNVNTTSYVPIKASPRTERSGSALDRYTDRIAVY